jgi:hypothetical protein
MMRFCPKCSDYYRDASLAFCLADGTPLVSVDPGGQNWSEGVRVIAKKAKALGKQRRRWMWRRVTVGTMMILTGVAFVVAAARSRFYLEPPPPPPPTITPLRSPTPTLALYKIDGRVMNQDKPLSGVKIMLGGAKPTSTTTDSNGKYAFNGLPAGGGYTITPKPIASMNFEPLGRSINNLTQDESADFGLVQPVLYKISGRVIDPGRSLPLVRITMFDGAKTVSTTTNKDGSYTFSGRPAGGSYTITPQRGATMIFEPSSRSINNLAKDESAVNFTRVPIIPTPTPTPTIVIKETPTPPPNECSGANQAAERKIIIPRISALLRPELIAGQGPAGARNVEAILREINYEVVFSRTCESALVTPSLRIPGQFIAKLRQFKCRKNREGWSCN